MADSIDIADITEGQNRGTITVRVLTKWKHYGSDAGLELLLIDEQDETIQASTDVMMMNRLDGRFEEGQTYKISNFVGVVNVKSRFLQKVTKHAFKINLKYQTVINVTSNTNISLTKYNFKTFSDVLNDRVPKDQFIDVIGRLVGVKPIGLGGRGKKWTVMTLQDQTGQELDCSVWDEFTQQAADIDSKYSNQTTRPVIVLHLVFCKEFQEQKRISTAKWATRFIINPDIPEVEEFKSMPPLDLSQASSSRGGAAVQADIFDGSTNQTIIRVNRDLNNEGSTAESNKSKGVIAKKW